jgi:hypothetical protein
MKSIMRGAAIAALAITLTATTFADNAEARRGRNGAIIGGLIVGGLIAGAAVANARERVYVRPSESCGEYRRRAISNEESGRPGRAQYWWDRYAECRGE